MISDKELGLVNTKELFKKAMAGGYAIPGRSERYLLINRMNLIRGNIWGPRVKR